MSGHDPLLAFADREVSLIIPETIHYYYSYLLIIYTTFVHTAPCNNNDTM